MVCYLVRHGKDDDTVRGGFSLSGLTDEGVLQVKNLTNYINENKSELKIEKLFSSDLPRAVQTAEPISALLSLEINIVPEFRETNNGILAGMPNDIACEKYPGMYWSALNLDEPYPQGESPRIFYERIKTAWGQFSKMILAENKNTVLVTHGGVINVIHTLIDGTIFSNRGNAEQIPYASMLPLYYTGKRWQKKDPSLRSR